MSDTEAVLKFMIEGQAYSDIVAFLVSEGDSPKAAAKSIQKALDKLDSVNETSAEVRRGWCIEAMREVYRRLLASGDYNGAIKAVKEIGLLSGAYPQKTKAKATLSPKTPKPEPNRGGGKPSLLKFKKNATRQK